MNPRPAPVVRLEGPLALGHGCISSSYGSRCPVYTLSPAPQTNRLLVISSGLARNRRGPETRSQPCRQRMGDCSRVLTSLPLVKPPCRAVHHCRIPSGPRTTRALPSQPPLSAGSSLSQRDPNVAERLALAPKTVSFCQSRFCMRRHANQPSGGIGRRKFCTTPIARINCRPEFLRRYAARRGRLSCPHLWITMWTDLSSSHLFLCAG